VQIESLVKGYLGWAGITAMNMVDAVARPFSANGPKPALQAQDWSLGFMQDLPANQSRYVDQLYAQKALIDQAYGSREAALRTGQFDKAREIMERQQALSPSNRSLLQQHYLAGSAAQSEANFALQERRIADSPNLSADTKRAMLNQIDQRRNALARSANLAELQVSQR
jgi:hypothetical protein